MAAPRLLLIGNPENRRIIDFTSAAEQMDWPRPECLSYESILEDPSMLDGRQADLVRIDSPGENETVANLLRRRGGVDNPEIEFGEIRHGAAYHRGYCDLLQEIQTRLALPCLTEPATIATLFDKAECHDIFVNHGLSRPQSHRAPRSLAEFQDWMRDQRQGRVFLKPLHGSSASGVCAFAWQPNRQKLIAPVRLVEGRLFNSLQVIGYESPAEIHAILEPLLEDGMICERWVRKFPLDGAVTDARVLVIAGKPRHWVVRSSSSPMTNLHLGNERADPDRFRSALGEDAFARMLEVAAGAAACFPKAASVGVDLLIDRSGDCLVGEANAFGDLLPRLVHRSETAYQAIARHALSLVS